MTDIKKDHPKPVSLTRAAANFVRSGTVHALGPGPALINSAAEGGRVIIDKFTPSQEQVGKGLEKTRVKIGEMLREAKDRDPISKVDDVVAQRGEGGYLTKAELRSVAPKIFNKVAEAPALLGLALPSKLSSNSTWRARPVETLLYSNNPERISKANVRLAQGELPAGATRLMSHHLNSGPSPIELRTRLTNGGNSAVILRLSPPAVETAKESEAANAGLRAVENSEKKGGKDTIVVLQPKQAFEWRQATVEPGDVLSSLRTVRSSGALQAVTAAVAPGVSIACSPLSSSPLENGKKQQGRQFRGTGVYATPDQNLYSVVDMTPGKLQQTCLGPNSDAPSATFPGEYGQVKHYHMTVGPNCAPGQRLVILGWAGGREPVSVATVHSDRNSQRIPRKGTGEEVIVMFEGQVRAGQTIELEQMVQGGAATPLRILALPVRAR